MMMFILVTLINRLLEVSLTALTAGAIALVSNWISRESLCDDRSLPQPPWPPRNSHDPKPWSKVYSVWRQSTQWWRRYRWSHNFRRRAPRTNHPALRQNNARDWLWNLNNPVWWHKDFTRSPKQIECHENQVAWIYRKHSVHYLASVFPMLDPLSAHFRLGGNYSPGRLGGNTVPHRCPGIRHPQTQRRCRW